MVALMTQKEVEETKKLARRLSQASVTKNTQSIILGMMREPGDVDKMISWMDNNPSALQREILRHAMDIRDNWMAKK